MIRHLILLAPAALCVALVSCQTTGGPKTAGAGNRYGYGAVPSPSPSPVSAMPKNTPEAAPEESPPAGSIPYAVSDSGCTARKLSRRDEGPW